MRNSSQRSPQSRILAPSSCRARLRAEQCHPKGGGRGSGVTPSGSGAGSALDPFRSHPARAHGHPCAILSARGFGAADVAGLSRDSQGARNSKGSTPCPLSAQQRQTQPLTATAPPAPRCHVPTGTGPQPVGPQPAHGGRAGHQAASSTAAPCAACPHRWHPTKPQARSQRQSQALRSPPAHWKAQSRISLATAALAACSPSTFTQLNVLA